MWKCWYCGSNHQVKKTLLFYVVCKCGRSGVRVNKKGKIETYGKPIFDNVRDITNDKG